MTPNEVIEKVRKLLNLANNAGATEGERENAMRMAHAFLAKHNLSMAELDNKPAEEDRGIVKTEFYSAPWSRSIAQSVAKLYFCKYLFIKGTKQHMFIGKTANATTASEMAKWLFKSVNQETRIRFPLARQGEHPGFQRGAADAIYWKVEEIIKASRQQASESKALVLADVYTREASANDDLIAKLFGSLGTNKTRKSNLNSSAYAQGQEYGKRVQLNTQIH